MSSKTTTKQPRVTEGHKRVFELLSENVRSGRRMTKKAMLKEAQYSPSVQNHPAHVFSSAGFQLLLTKISDDVILQRFLKIITSGEDRDAITAGKELLKLKDRYPANKLMLQGYNEELGSISE